MMWVLLGLAIVVVGVVGFAAVLASRAKQAYDSSNEVVPGMPTSAPASWAGSHDPEARLHRRLRDAMAALRANQLFDDDGGMLDLRVELEQQALALDERLVAIAALAPALKERPLSQATADVALLEKTVAELAAAINASARPALEAAIARVRERVDLLEQANESLEHQVLDLGGPAPAPAPEVASAPPVEQGEVATASAGAPAPEPAPSAPASPPAPPAIDGDGGDDDEQAPPPSSPSTSG